MTLRNKILITVTLTVFCTTVVFYWFTNRIVLGGFSELQKEFVRNNVQRAQNALKLELTTIGKICGDWAPWNETRNFILGNNTTYKRDNLNIETFNNLNVNFMAFYDSRNNLVHIEQVDLANKTSTQASPELKELLKRTTRLFQHKSPHDGKTGILPYQENPVLVSSWPITNNVFKAPIHGTLIIGRIFDKNEITNLAKRTRQNLAFFKTEVSGELPEIRDAISAITKEAPITVRQLNKDMIAGYASIPDINGSPYLVLKVESPRTIFNRGKITVRTFFIFFIAFGITVLAILIILIERSMVRPLFKLNRHVTKIQETKELDVHLDLASDNSEWASLTRAFNQMTAGLNDALKVLEERERFIHSLVESMPQCVFSKDLEGRFTFANRAYCSTEEKQLSDIIGKTDFDLHPYELAIKYRNDDKRVCETGQIYEYEEDHVPKGKERIVVRIIKTPLYDATNQISGILGIFWDITAQKIAVESIKNSEKKYRLLADNIIDNIWVLNLETLRYTYVSPSVKNITGYTADEVMGFQLKDVLTPPSLDHAIGIVEDELASDDKAEPARPRTLELEQYHQKGGSVWTEVSIRFIRNKDGRPVDILGVTRDISQRKLLESQLQQAQKMEAVGTLAGGVAHDFNNILQAINGYTQILLTNKTENDPDYTKLMGIQIAGEKATQLVRQLLIFSRKVEAERKVIDINHEIKNTISMLERTIPKMINIELLAASRLWAVNADPVQIDQILLNLGSNAADAMPDGGTLLIKTENITFDKEHMQKHAGVPTGNYVRITLTDTGKGMDQETLEHIFEPFYTTKEIGKGTGLGLATVYGIVKNHGGNIICRSNVGQGSCFTIYLPALEQSRTVISNDYETRLKQHGSETILLVDDERPIREIASETLQQKGYNILSASSGEEALEVYSRKHDDIDLIIMDIGMPGMGGVNCLHEILKINPLAKVIIASGYFINDQMKNKIDMKASGFIGKPFKIKDLLSKVREVLDENE